MLTVREYVSHKVVRKASVRRQMNCSSTQSVLLRDYLEQHSVAQIWRRKGRLHQGWDSANGLAVG